MIPLTVQPVLCICHVSTTQNPVSMGLVALDLSTPSRIGTSELLVYKPVCRPTACRVDIVFSTATLSDMQ